ERAAIPGPEGGERPAEARRKVDLVVEAATALAARRRATDLIVSDHGDAGSLLTCVGDAAAGVDHHGSGRRGREGEARHAGPRGDGELNPDLVRVEHDRVITGLRSLAGV